MANKKGRSRAAGEGALFWSDSKKAYVGRYRYTDEHGVEHRPQVQAKNQEKAAERLQALIKRIEDGRPPRDSKATVAAYAESWLDTTMQAGDRKESTKKKYRNAVKNQIANRSLGEVQLGRVRPTTIERWLAELRAAGYATATVQAAYVVLDLILKTAVRDGLMAENPLAVVARPRIDDRDEAIALDVDQAARLLAELEGNRMRPAVVLLLHTGLRVSEMAALQWRSVHIGGSEPYLDVRRTVDDDGNMTAPKSKRSRRRVPLDSAAVAALEEVKQRAATDKATAANRWVGADRVFLDELGEPINRRRVAYWVERAAMTSGVAAEVAASHEAATVGPHTMRHTAATLMLRAGVPLPMVSRILGHANVGITDAIYGHLTSEDTRGGIETLGKVLAS